MDKLTWQLLPKSSSIFPFMITGQGNGILIKVQLTDTSFKDSSSKPAGIDLKDSLITILKL